MGEILPDGSIQGYSMLCKKCYNTISCNMQGDEMGTHECKQKEIWLIGCEESQAITSALRERGINAWSCDLKDCSGPYPQYHLKMDVFEAIKLKRWTHAVFNPDCTYITVTANKWLKDQPPRKSGALVGAQRRAAKERALQFVVDLMNCGIPRIAIENPVGSISTRIAFENGKYILMPEPNEKRGLKPDQVIQPYQFGHPEPKKTCLWLQGFPLLKPTEIVDPEYHTTESGKRLPKWYAYADKSKGQAHRAEIRSKTFPGIAKAIADQWGGFWEDKRMATLF